MAQGQSQLFQGRVQARLQSQRWQRAWARFSFPNHVKDDTPVMRILVVAMRMPEPGRKIDFNIADERGGLSELPEFGGSKSTDDGELRAVYIVSKHVGSSSRHRVPSCVGH